MIKNLYAISLGLLMLGLSLTTYAQDNNLGSMICPDDVTIECGQDINDYDLTGTPTVTLLVGAGYELVSSDVVMSSNDCQTVVARTWTALLNELGESFGSLVCTQVITIADNTGPVLSGVPASSTVACIDDVPAASGSVTALDACSGASAVSSFVSATGTPLTSCTLTTAFGPGADWAVWLPSLSSAGYTAGANYVFGAAGGVFEQYADNTAHLTGELVNTLNPNQRFIADLWFQNKRDWTSWNNGGTRSYKNDLNLQCAIDEHVNWSYYELVGGFSTLTGAGDLAGDQLYLYHLPTNYYFGFQIGIGANDKNCNYGMSGWFSYNGFMNNTYVSATGDMNVDAQCSDVTGDCANRTAVTQVYRAEDACGHATLESTTITVFDDVAPTFTNCPAPVTLSCTDETPAAINPEATDNCSGDVTVSFVGDTEEGDNCLRTVTRTWMAEDECGNVAYCSQIITFLDEEAPVFVGTPDATVTAECDNIPAAAVVTATDNCDSDVSVSFTESSEEGNCAGSYTITRTWTSTDDCGNQSSFTQTIQVVDTTAPEFNEFPIYTSAECNEEVDAPTATDNCSGATVTLVSEVLNSGGCLGVLARTYRATDGCGNYAEVVQYITLVDTTAPEISGVPAEATVECSDVNLGENGLYFGVAPVTATDICDESVDINYTEEILDNGDNCPSSFDIIRTWVAVDECENETSASAIVHVVDTTNPWFVDFPADITINCDEDVPAVVLPEAQDNCSANVVVVATADDIIPGTCPQNYTIYRVYRAIDNCGNQAVETQVITVRDITAPVFSTENNASLTYECDQEIPVIEPSVSDNCGDVTLSYSDSDAQGNTCLSSFERVWTATDECGNASDFVQTIQVVDTTAPIISGDLQINRPCDDYMGTFISVNDNCSEYTVDYADVAVSGGCAGNIIRTYVATDACGNVSDEFIQVIQLTDETAPSIDFVTESRNVECGDVYSVEPATFSDNCDQELEIESGFSSDSDGCTTVETYTWTATDHCGNSTTATTVITIVDTTNPYFTSLPENVTVNCDEEVPSIGEYSAADSCDPEVEISVEETTTAGNCPQAYTIVRTFTAIDNCNNTTTEVRYVYVVDIEAPVFEEGTTSFTYECGAEIPVVEPSAGDNCGDVSLSYVDGDAQGNSCQSSFERVWTATDDCGNASQLTQTIEIVDTTAPVITGSLEISRPCDNYEGIFVEASDICSEYTIEYSDVLVSGGCAGNVIRTYVATDECGNASAEFVQVITLTDETAPEIAYVQGDFNSECGDEYTVEPASFSDNCDDNLIIETGFSSETDGCSTTETYTWTATDHCGNSTTATTVVTIVDTTDPYFTSLPENITVSCDEEVPGYGEYAAADNCDTDVVVSVSQEEAPGDCPQSTVITRVYRATDNCGNEAVETRYVYVVDTTAPVFAEQANSFSYECGSSIPVIEPTVADNCGQVTYFYTDGDAQGNSCETIIVRTWTAADECGNSSTFDQTITLVDTTAPVINAEIQISRPCDDVNGNYVVVTDECSDYTISSTDLYVSGGCAGAIIRTYVAADACGNVSAEFTQFISLSDAIAPTAEVANPEVSINCDEELPSFNVSFNDNCDDDMTITDLEDEIIAGNCPAQYTIIRRKKAVDHCDNEVIATQTISVSDNEAPVWADGNETSFVYECGTEAAVVTPEASDNCSEFEATYEDSNYWTYGCLNGFVRSWIVTDACGNISDVFIQNIAFEDTTEPMLSNCPADLILNCDEEVPAPADVTVTDACDENVQLFYEETILGDMPAEGSIADCDLITPARPANNPCAYPYDWALTLFGMPSAHRWYQVVDGNLTRYENGSIHLVAQMENAMNPGTGWNLDVWFEGGWDWATWSSQDFPTSFKADCGGIDANFASWTYFLLVAGEGAELTGYGAYEGSALNLSHAPANNYFGFQLGDGANNYNAANDGFGGWISYNGTFRTSSTAAFSNISGAGDIALELDCCPDYSIVRQWTAIDCSGNSVTCSQTISFSPTAAGNQGQSTTNNEAISTERFGTSINVAPNPANSNTVFSFKAAMTAKTTLELFDLTGQKVADIFMGTVEEGASYNVNFDVSSLATGLYTYRLTNGTDVQIQRLIISK